jgi:hypothetical protein
VGPVSGLSVCGRGDGSTGASGYWWGTYGVWSGAVGAVGGATEENELEMAGFAVGRKKDNQ